MIQIQSPAQFTKAADRLRQEPQSIRRHEPGLWMVTNNGKGTTYPVRITRFNGSAFITCGCPAGTPDTDRTPLVCKHAAAVVIFLRAVREMRRATVNVDASAATVGEEWDDDDDPDTNINHWSWQ
jgi:hypothetical protein